MGTKIILLLSLLLLLLLLLLLSLLLLLLLLLCAVKKRMYAKIEPHRARSVTYAILRNYKKKTAELKKN